MQKYTVVISVLGRWRQGNVEFKASLGHTVRLFPRTQEEYLCASPSYSPLGLLNPAALRKGIKNVTSVNLRKKFLWLVSREAVERSIRVLASPNLNYFLCGSGFLFLSNDLKQKLWLGYSGSGHLYPQNSPEGLDAENSRVPTLACVACRPSQGEVGPSEPLPGASLFMCVQLRRKLVKLKRQKWLQILLCV